MQKRFTAKSACPAFFTFTLFFVRKFSPENMLLLLCGGIVTPVFEELLFRGMIRNRLCRHFSREWQTDPAVTALFELWHIGYAVGIYLWQGGDLLHCILMKVFWGTLYGLALGAFRLKTKNCYLGMLIHGVLNVFG